MADFRLVGTTATGDSVPVLVNSDGTVVVRSDSAAVAKAKPWDIKWRPVVSPFPSACYGVCWSEQKGRAVAVFQTTGTAASAWSEDGVTWTAGDLAPGVSWTGVSYAADRGEFLAYGYISLACYVSTSSDGKTWTTPGSPLNCVPERCLWSERLGLYVLIGMYGTVPVLATSHDAIAWTPRDVPADFTLSSLCIADEIGKVVVAGGKNNQPSILTSENGAAWTASAPQPVSFKGIAWSPKQARFAVFSGGSYAKGMWWTDDLITFHAAAGNRSQDTFKVRWLDDANVFMTVVTSARTGGELLDMSEDGKTYVSCELHEGKGFRDVCVAPALGLLIAGSMGLAQLAPIAVCRYK